MQSVQSTQPTQVTVGISVDGPLSMKGCPEDCLDWSTDFSLPVTSAIPDNSSSCQWLEVRIRNKSCLHDCRMAIGEQMVAY